jgi:hypothetical protein
MYVSDKFVYTELHKTAGTHIGKWLNTLAPGKQVGKHNVIPSSILNDRLVLGSIRNPWDWYVSLWGYGCDQKGSVYLQTTNKINVKYYLEQLPAEMNITFPTPSLFMSQFIADIKKPCHEWEESYEDSSSPACFKSWLKLMFDNNRRFDMREGYGFSPISNYAGIMTYRFLKFFTNLESTLHSESLLTSNINLLDLWENHKIADFFIRMEHLEDDLITAMKIANVQVSSENKTSLINSKNMKTNTSSRLNTSCYFDEETTKLVSDKEKLIIQLFNYLPPNPRN